MRAACVAVETILAKSAVLSTLPRPTMAFVMPDTVPVNVGEAKLAFKLRAVNTLVVPLIKLPETIELVAVAVPVNAGLAKGARNAKSVVDALLFNSVNTLVVQLTK